MWQQTRRLSFDDEWYEWVKEKTKGHLENRWNWASGRRRRHFWMRRRFVWPFLYWPEDRSMSSTECEFPFTYPYRFLVTFSLLGISEVRSNSVGVFDPRTGRSRKSKTFRRPAFKKSVRWRPFRTLRTILTYSDEVGTILPIEIFLAFLLTLFCAFLT